MTAGTNLAYGTDVKPLASGGFEASERPNPGRFACRGNVRTRPYAPAGPRHRQRGPHRPDAAMVRSDGNDRG